MSVDGGTEGSRAERTPGAAYGWVIVALAFLSTGLVLGSRFSTGMFLPFLPEAFDTSATSVSAAVALSMIGAAALQPIVGYALDQMGGRVVLSLGLGFAGVALCGTALATAFWQVVLLMGLATSVGYASASPVSATAIVTGWFDKNRGTALGMATSGTKVAMILLPPAIAAMISLYDWRTAMMVIGIAILALIPAVMLFMRPAPGYQSVKRSAKRGTSDGLPLETDTSSTVREALKIPSFWLLAISLFANGMVMNLVFVHLPSYLMALGFDTTVAATSLALLGGIGIAGTVVTGWMSDWLGRRQVLFVMFGTRAVALLLVVLLPNIFTFAGFLLAFGVLGYGAIGVIGSLATSLFGRRAIGTILGLAYVFNQAGGAVGTFAGGAALGWTGGFDAAIWLAVGTTAFALPCIWLLSPRGENRRTTT